MKTLTLFRVYQLAGRNMKYVIGCRARYAHRSDFGILVADDQYAREYQLWDKMQIQAEHELVKRLTPSPAPCSCRFHDLKISTFNECRVCGKHYLREAR